MATLMIMSTEKEKNAGKHRVYEDIFDAIMQQIRDGSLPPGSRLPSERELAKEFQASRTAVREALHMLASRGCIDSKVGDGTYVREVTLDTVLKPLSDLLSRDRKAIRDVLDVRIILETESARRAAENADRQDILHIEEAIDAMQAEIDRGHTGLELDVLFHQRLADSSGNEAIAQILRMCADLLMKSTRNSLGWPGRPQESVDDHRRILKLVEQHEARLASEEMRRHLEKGYALLEPGRLQAEEYQRRLKKAGEK